MTSSSSSSSPRATKEIIEAGYKIKELKLQVKRELDAYFEWLLDEATHEEKSAVAETVEGVAQQLQREALRLKRLSRGELKETDNV